MILVVLKNVKNGVILLVIILGISIAYCAQAEEGDYLNSLSLPTDINTRQEILIEDLYELMQSNSIPPKLSLIGVKKQDIDLKAFWYNFDPILSGSLSYTHSDQEALQGRTQNNSIGGDIRLERPDISGYSWWVEHNLGWSEVDSTITSHLWGPSLSVGVTKQLGEGGSERINRLGLEALKNTREYLDFSYKDTVKSQKNTLILSYLNTAFQIDSISVRHKNLEYARDLLNRNIARYKVGLGTKADLLSAESQVKQQEAMLASDVKSLDDALGEIELLVGVNGLSTKVRPVSLLKIIDNFQINQSEDQIVKMAFDNDRELVGQLNSLKNLNINEQQLRDQLKPSHSISVSATRSGSDKEVWDSYTKMNDSKYSVIYNYRQSLGEREAKSRIEKNKLDVDSALLSIEQRKLDISNNCRNLIRSIEQLKTQIQFENASVASSTENYDAQKMRNRQGLATTIDELASLQALLGAELSRLGTVLQLNQKWLSLQKLIGSENYKIQNYEF